MGRNVADTATRTRLSSPRDASSFFREKLSLLNAREGLSAGWLWIAFVVTLLCIFARDPSLFTHPQFWAEDGRAWYAQAYNLGWLHSLKLPLGGYLNTLQRLAAGLALLVPFRWAPLPMVLVGLLMQALPVPILLSPRCRKWAPLPMRLLFAAIYIAIPNAREVHVVCTNAQWHLAVSELLLAFAAPPRRVFGRIFDIAIFLLGSVCGPFAILLIPFLILFWWIRRQRWTLVVLGVLGAGSLLQLSLLRHYQVARHARYLGASFGMFARLLGGDVFLGALIGTSHRLYDSPLVVPIVLMIVGLAICAYCFRFASVEVRLFFVYCASIFAASLRSPLVPATPESLWYAIAIQPSMRYWFFPSLPFLFAVLWCAFFARNRAARVTGVLLALIMCRGIIKDWEMGPLVDMHFAQYAAAFEAAKPGTHVIIPLNPPTGEWKMDLIKK